MSIKLLIPFFLAILFLTCCKSKNVNYAVSKTQNIVLIDTCLAHSHLLDYDKNERMGAYPVYYIGIKKDSIFLPNFGIEKYNKSRVLNDSCSTIKSENDLSIFVDTGCHITHNVACYKYLEGTTKLVFDSINSIKSYAVFIKNNTNKNFNLGWFNILNIVSRQAKNKNNQWQNIETNCCIDCITDANKIILKPNNIVIAKALRYSGKFKTECRLKLWNSMFSKTPIYSNSFYDFIDERKLQDSL